MNLIQGVVSSRAGSSSKTYQPANAIGWRHITSKSVWLFAILTQEASEAIHKVLICSFHSLHKFIPLVFTIFTLIYAFNSTNLHALANFANITEKLFNNLNFFVFWRVNIDRIWQTVHVCKCSFQELLDAIFRIWKFSFVKKISDKLCREMCI